MQNSSSIEKAIAAANNQKFAEAEKHLTNHLLEHPGDADAQRMAGQIAMLLNKQNEAINFFIESLRLDPNNVGALTMVGNLFLSKGDIPTALNYYDSALKLDPNNSILLNNVGGILIRQGKVDEGIDSLKKSLLIDPSNIQSYYMLGQVYGKNGKINEAFDILLDGLKNGVDRPENDQIKPRLTELSVNIAGEIVKNTNYFNLLEPIIKDLEAKCGIPIQIMCDRNLSVCAKLKYARHHGEDRHVILFNADKPYYEHLILHELTHLKMLFEADNYENGRIIYTTDANVSAFTDKFAPYVSNSSFASDLCR